MKLCKEVKPAINSALANQQQQNYLALEWRIKKEST